MKRKEAAKHCFRMGAGVTSGLRVHRSEGVRCVQSQEVTVFLIWMGRSRLGQVPTGRDTIRAHITSQTGTDKRKGRRGPAVSICR